MDKFEINLDDDNMLHIDNLPEGFASKDIVHGIQLIGFHGELIFTVIRNKVTNSDKTNIAVIKSGFDTSIQIRYDNVRHEKIGKKVTVFLNNLYNEYLGK
jgi:hypothetical protein